MMFAGIVPNALTPMDIKGHPDKKGIYALVEFLIESKINGLWILGSAGEDIHISIDDKCSVIQTFSNAIDGRIPSVMGLGSGGFYDYMTLCEKINTEKIDAFHFLPYDQKIGDSALISYVLKLADSLPCPLWLYHNPKRGRVFTLNIVSELKQHENIIGIKVGGYNLSDLTQMMMLADNNFEVAGAGGGQFYQMLCLGAKSHFSSDANCFPEIFHDIFQLFNKGKYNEALALQYRFIELSKRLPRTDNGEYAAEEKYMMILRGVKIKEYVNPAYRILNQNEKILIGDILKEFGYSWA